MLHHVRRFLLTLVVVLNLLGGAVAPSFATDPSGQPVVGEVTIQGGSNPIVNRVPAASHR